MHSAHQNVQDKSLQKKLTIFHLILFDDEPMQNPTEQNRTRKDTNWLELIS